MANGHIDMPICHSHDTSSTGANASATENMEDTVEYRILMAYAQKRRPKTDSPGTPAKDTPSPQTPAEAEKGVKEEEKKRRKTKRKGGWRCMGSILKCIKPQTEEEDMNKTNQETGPAENLFRTLEIREDDGAEGEDEMDNVATRLTKIADEVPFVPPEIEHDGHEGDNVEKLIGLLLRESGDEFHRSVLKDANLTSELFGNYSFFERLMTTFFRRMGFSTFNPDALGPQGSPKTHIALMCEVTSRLSAVDTLPMSRMLDHGARYLQDHYSAWAQQHGGYEKVFDGEDEEEVN
ncbi:hypothetical protein LDENG_00148290 [Lucifuga dentata]|nr:hypothetical protein LDENG_00148290 [Lucifuga dentata]